VVAVAAAAAVVAAVAASAAAVAVAAVQPWTEASNYQTTWASTDWSANERGLKWERLLARVEALGQLEALAEPQLGPSADCRVAREERLPVAGYIPMDAAHHPVKRVAAGAVAASAFAFAAAFAAVAAIAVWPHLPSS
jgi:hypothetical protein